MSVSNSIVIVIVSHSYDKLIVINKCRIKLEMWASAKRDGHTVKYRWRPLFNAAKFG